MNLKEATINYANLVAHQDKYLQDLAAKYSIIADNYIASGTLDDIKINKKKLSVILADNIVNLMIFLKLQGQLNAYIARNPNLGTFLDPKHPNSVTKAAMKLKNTGCAVNKDEKITSLSDTLKFWDVEEVRQDDIDDIDMSDIEGEESGQEQVYNDIFDDLNTEGGQVDPAPIPVPVPVSKKTVPDPAPVSEEPAPAPAPAPVHNIDVARPSQEVTPERVLSDEEKEDLRRASESFQYKPNVVKAEESSNTSVVEIGDKLEEDGKSNTVQPWADDRLPYTDKEFKSLDVDVSSEIEGTVVTILQRIESALRSCFELDRPYGILTEDGLLKYHTDPNTRKLLLDAPNSQKGLSEMEKIYKGIVQSAGVVLNAAPHNSMVPNYHNLTSKESGGYNYYPGYMMRLALGFVNGKRHKKWSTFEKDLKSYLERRLYELYKKDSYYEYINKITEAFSNVMLVTDYSASGMKIRTSLINMRPMVDTLKDKLQSEIPSMSNSEISVFPVSNRRDVVDIQITRDPDALLNKPSWAYKALRVMIDNGDKISLMDGIPMGQQANGEMVTFKCATDTFSTFIAAGSRSGKGVLTLSLVAAALGSGMPVMYMDYKPDMAPIFWEMTKGKGIETYSFDAAVPFHKRDPNSGYKLGESIPYGLKGKLEDIEGAMLYLKGLQIMCTIARLRAYNKISNSTPLLFIFDEIQSMQRNINLALRKVQQLYDANKPSKKGDDEGDPEAFKYAESILNWVIDIENQFTQYYQTYAGVSNVFVVGIGQNANKEIWIDQVASVKVGTSTSKLKLFSHMVDQGSAVKILGRGTVGGSEYGLYSSSVTKEETERIAKYRYFGTYVGSKSKNIKATVFKPFLTLNYSDIFAPCWTNGVGKTYGYRVPIGGGDPVASNQDYIENMQRAFPGEPGLTDPVYGTHIGTGLEGLASMYCGGDTEKIKNALQASWLTVIDMFEKTGLSSRYDTPADFLYDMSADSWLQYKDIENFKNREAEQNGGIPTEYGEDDGTTGLDMDEPNTPAQSTITQPLQGGTSSGTVDDDLEDDEDDEDELGAKVETPPLKEPVLSPEMQARMAAINELTRQGQMDPINLDPAPINESAPIPEPAPIPESSGTSNTDILDNDDFSALFNGGQQVQQPITPSQPTQPTQPQQTADEQRQQIDVNDEQRKADARRAQIANQILSGLGSPDVERLIAEGGLQSVMSTPYDAEEAEAIPDITSPNEHRTLTQLGRNIVCTPDNIAKLWGLKGDNAVLAKMPEYSTVERMSKPLFRSMWGTQYEFKNRWKAILRSVVGKINPGLVTRMLLTENIIQFNQTQVCTYNILGGDEDIRIEDIADFKMTAKRFPNIKHIRLDEELYAKAAIDFGDPLVGLFTNFRSLQLLEVYQGRSGAKINEVTRDEFNEQRVNQDMMLLQEKTRMKQQMEVIAAAKNPNLRSQSPGYQNRVWTSCKNMSGNSWKAAGDAMMAKNPRLFKASMLGLAGVALIGIGAVGGLAGKIRSLIRGG